MSPLSHLARTARSSAVRDLLRLTERPDVLSLAGGLPTLELLPVDALAAATASVLARHGAAALQYGPTEGIGALRELAAARLGHRATAATTIVTTGSQQGLDLVARCLLDPGDVVVTEVPTYLGALGALHWSGARVVGVDGDAAGLRTGELEERLRAGLRPKLVYVVADFANPTGATLDTARRSHLAALAEQYGFVVVEDDPYGALRWRGERLAPVRAWSDRVVTLGTASKVLAPGLRVGWLTAPDWLAGAITIAKQGADLHTSTLNQWLVHDLLADRGWFDAHVAALVATYESRCTTLVDALTRDGVVEIAAPDGGMFVWCALGDPSVGTSALLGEALEHGVAFVPGAAFRPDGADDHRLRVCFTTLDPAQLDEAAARLAAAAGAVVSPAR
ncbi:MAG: PLP-dependent aminotransferase family protein [Ilumatobacteraceae bacterium]